MLPPLSSEGSHKSVDRRCPHAMFRDDTNRFGWYQPLSTYLESATECPECDLLLRVVEEFKPGWIGEYKNGRGLIHVSHERSDFFSAREVPALITLLLGPPYNGIEYLAHTELVDSFQFFRSSRGMFGCLWPIPSLLYSSVASSEPVLDLCLFI